MTSAIGLMLRIGICGSDMHPDLIADGGGGG